MPAQPKRRAIIRWVVAAGFSLVFAALWILSFTSTSGVGIGTPPNAPIRRNLEVSLGHGGLVVVINGSRTDVSYYDANMGCQYGWGPVPWLYVMELDRVNAPYIWLPSIAQPLGTYILIPFWMLVAAPPLLLLAYLRWRHRKLPGHCSACGYNLAGLTAPLCPECGQAMKPAKTAVASASAS